RNRFSHEVASKTSDQNILAKFGDFCVQEFLNRLIGIFDKTLYKQTDSAVKLVELALNNLTEHVRGFAFHLRLVNGALRVVHLRRHLFPAYVERMRRGNVKLDVFYEIAEILFPSHKVVLAISFHEHANFPLQMKVRSDNAFFVAREAFLPALAMPFI